MQILRDDQGGVADSPAAARCAVVRKALVSKYGCDPHAELELHQWWHIIIEELGGDPGDWHIVCWTGSNAEGVESVGSGGRCARLRHFPGHPGHFVPVWSEAASRPPLTPLIREEEPEAPGESKEDRARRLARNRKIRAANRLRAETPDERKLRMARERVSRRRNSGDVDSRDMADRSKRRREDGARETGLAQRSQKRRAEGTHEPNGAERPQKRRDGGTHELDVAARSQKRRDECTHEPDVANRSQKRREDGTHEINIAARSQKRRDEVPRDPDIASRSNRRREEGTHEPSVASRSQKRRAEGTHEPDIAARSRRRSDDASRDPEVADGAESRNLSDADLSIKALCRGTGVAYIEPQIGGSNSDRERRHERMRLLSLRTGRPAGWRDTCPIEDRASAVGVSLRTPAPGEEAATRRANARAVLGREETYLRTRPVLTPPPVAPPPDTPIDMVEGAARALSFERVTGSFAIGTCSRCRETRLNASYFRVGQEDQICRRCKLDKQCLFTEENNASPIWRDADGVAHYDVPGALSCLTLA